MWLPSLLMWLTEGLLIHTCSREINRCTEALQDRIFCKTTMFIRLERIIEPCLGLGYTRYAAHLNQRTHPELCKEWDTRVGYPLENLECPVGFKKPHAPVTWKHPRPCHIRDPFLRDITLQYWKKGGLEETRYLFFGCDSIEKLNIWFPEPIRNIMINEFGFGLKRYTAKLVWHGLRQSMLDSRSIIRVTDLSVA